MNHTIAGRQSSPESERLFKAFSWHYRRAKIWRSLFAIGTIGLAGASPIFVLWFPDCSKWLAALAGAWLLVGRLAMQAAERTHRREGAKIHDKFDRNLFGLDWNRAVAGPPPAEEDVTDAASRFGGPSKQVKDWYPNTHDASRPTDVLLCQRSSAVWGRRDHHAYARVLVSIATVWLVAGIALAILRGLSLEDYLVSLFLPSQPAFVDAIELIQFHFKQARSKGDVEGRLDELLEKLLRGERVGDREIEMIQEQLFQFRRDGAYVPTLFYRIRRPRGQLAMQDAVDQYLGRAQAK
jgi:hypothetical protein